LPNIFNNIFSIFPNLFNFQNIQKKEPVCFLSLPNCWNDLTNTFRAKKHRTTCNGPIKNGYAIIWTSAASINILLHVNQFTQVQQEAGGKETEQTAAGSGCEGN
jgi:hypothetical protein